MKKSITLVIISVIVVMMMAMVGCSDNDNNTSSIEPEKITNIYLINGVTDEVTELTEDEYNLVADKITELKFKKEGEMPSLQMCIVVKTSYDKEFVLKYDQTEGLYLSGEGITGYFEGGKDIESILINAEKKYAYGSMIDYAEIANSMKNSSVS
ncbi:MAG: hypothetical protein II257_03860 [Clostridia bacterium]|nr:hypothetical protein [Clostridia bacterium]